MFHDLAKYNNNGHLFYERGVDITNLSQNLPNEPGVFYILKRSKKKIKLTYIGKSDSSKTENKTLNLLFRDKEKGISLQDFFDKKMKEEDIDSLDIHWFNTEDDNPSEIANKLLQNNNDFFGSLPDWNKSFK